MAWGARIDWYGDDLAGNLITGWGVFLLLIQAGMRDVADDMEQWGKANHPWGNVTGEAEANLSVDVMGFDIVAKSGAPHGVYLENKQGGRWGVIPAMLDYGDTKITAMARDAFQGAW